MSGVSDVWEDEHIWVDEIPTHDIHHLVKA